MFNVYIDICLIMYGFGGYCGIVWIRVLLFLMYVVGLFVGVVVILLILFGFGLL